MKKFFIFWILSWLLFSSNLVFGQKYYLIPHLNRSTLFIDENGEEKFRLPFNHKISIFKYQDKNGETDFGIPFQIEMKDPILVSNAKNNDYNYWIDGEGQIIRDFKGLYSKIAYTYTNKGPAYYAYAIKADENGLKGLYLDENGNPLFEGKRFKTLRSFSEGLAHVELNKKRDWAYVNQKGEVVIHPTALEGLSIRSVQPFYEGLARVRLDDPNKREDEIAFINTLGEIVFNVSELIEVPENQFFQVLRMENGLVYAYHTGRPVDSNGFYFFNKKGEIVKQFLGDILFENYHNKYFFLGEIFVDAENKKRRKFSFLDEDFEPIECEITDSIQRQRFIQKPTFKNGYFMYSISKSDGLWTYVYDLKELKLVFKTKMKFLEIAENAIFLEELGSRRRRLQDFDDNIIWQDSVELMTYKFLKYALPVKERVKTFDLQSLNDFNEDLYELINLEDLTLNYAPLYNFPDDLYRFTHLKTLRLNRLRGLTKLPESISQIPSLEYLEVAHLMHYQEGLEYIIEHSPNLKKVMVTGNSLEDGFLERMKKERPSLAIIKK